MWVKPFADELSVSVRISMPNKQLVSCKQLSDQASSQEGTGI
jgi:hypothetical protein